MNRNSANILLLLAVTVIVAVSVMLFLYAMSMPDVSEKIPVLVGAFAGLAGALWLGSYIWIHRYDRSD